MLYTHTSLRYESRVTSRVPFTSVGNLFSLIKVDILQSFTRVTWSNRKAQNLECIKRHMASAEEVVKNENSSAQSNNSSETSKPSQPGATNPVNNTASSKVNERFSHTVASSY